MKRLNRKTVVLAAGLLLIGSGAYFNYQMAQRAAESQMSDLTLANLEAMAGIIVDYDNPADSKDGWCVGPYGKCDEPLPGVIISGGFVSKH